MKDGKYLFSKADKIYFIKMIGSLKYTISEPFNLFLEQIFADDDFDNILIDLTEAEFLDSTNLGLLAKVASFLRKKNKRKITLISDNHEINLLLKNIGFDKVFIIIKRKSYDDTDLEELNSETNDIRSNTKMILEAHEHLMELNDKNKETFKSVVEIFRRQMSD